MKKYTTYAEGDTSIWGKAVATIHAQPEVILAWLWFYCSNLRTKEHHKKDGNLLRTYYETDNKGSRTQHICVR